VTAQTVSAPFAKRYPIGKILMAGTITIIISVALNYLVYWVATSLLGIKSDFGPFASPIFIALYTVVFLVIAILVWWWIARRSQTPETTFKTVALFALILSLIPNVLLLFMRGPAELGTPTPPAMLVLTAMHVVTWLVTISVLPRFSRE